MNPWSQYQGVGFGPTVPPLDLKVQGVWDQWREPNPVPKVGPTWDRLFFRVVPDFSSWSQSPWDRSQPVWDQPCFLASCGTKYILPRLTNPGSPLIREKPV